LRWADRSLAKELSTSEVKAILDSERADSLSSQQATKLVEERGKALDYYLGDMADDLPTLPDRSTAVSTDVADAIEGLMPSLMEIFASGDEVVMFEPVGQEDEDAAAQEGDYVNHVLMQENRGFLVLHDFIKDGLLSKNGYVKVWWEEGERTERVSWKGLSDDAYALVVEDETLTVEEHKAYPDDTGTDAPEAEAPMAPPAALDASGGQGMPPGAPQMPGMPPMPQGGDLQAIPSPPMAPVVPAMLHDVTARRRTEYGCAKVENVPPEEFGISRRAKRIADAPYCFHETTSTQQDLIAQGFDEAMIVSLPSSTTSDTEEEQARDTVDESESDEGGTLNRASRPIRVLEEYIRMDYDGQGAKLYRVTRGGTSGEILTRDKEPSIEEVDEIPFATVSPIRMPHRHYGRSIADVVMDIQRIKTALTRNLLDNAYRANNQRTEIAQSHATDDTIDDWVDNRIGGIVRTKQPGGLVPIPNTPIGDFAFPMIQYMDERLEQRTGVTKQGQGLDPNALQNIGENAILDAANAARARTKFIARVMAEGIRDLCSLLHNTIRKNAQKAATVRLRNKWVEVDPRSWKARNDVTVTVGLGSGSKEQQIQFLMGILGIQEKAIMTASPLVTPENIYNTLEKLIQNGGLRSVQPYFTDPKTAPPQPPKPDPKMVEAEGKLKLQAAEAQASQQLSQQQAMADLQLAVAKMQEEAKLEREKAAEEARQSMLQMQTEAALRIKEMQAEHQLEMVRMRMNAGVQMAGNATKERVGIDANERRANISAVRPGGKVG
jgi:hypothetical protein